MPYLIIIDFYELCTKDIKIVLTSDVQTKKAARRLRKFQPQFSTFYCITKYRSSDAFLSESKILLTVTCHECFAQNQWKGNNSFKCTSE